MRTISRNQFDCQSLEGAQVRVGRTFGWRYDGTRVQEILIDPLLFPGPPQLENQPTGADSCTGDHWDERLYYDNALSGVISPTTNILVPMTLALFEDSGTSLLILDALHPALPIPVETKSPQLIYQLQISLRLVQIKLYTGCNIALGAWCWL